MSTALIEAEIRRFLASDVPEVLCIKGRWGVGKTFAWLKYLGDAQSAGELKANAYAYVSLFGLNTLDDLRFAIFENTVTAEHALSGPDVGTFSAMVRRGVDIGRKSKPYLDMVLASLGWGDRGNAFAKASFLLVRDQLICLDDLERAGEGLHQRDVLGLASSLKEQRHCKVVLLLNDEEMEEEQRAEFDRQLEKVVDISLVFAPTSAEAADIAIAADSPIGAMLRPRVVALGIVNIRVIKKIERLALRLYKLLQRFGEPVLDQAIVTVVLGGWSALQPKLAPPLEFVRGYSRLLLEMRSQNDDLAAEELRWRDQLQEYDFGSADELDLLIFDGVSRGFFDEQRLVEAAAIVQERLAHHSRDNSFSRAWDQYHGSLTLDEAKVLDDLHTGAMENLPFISPININATMKLLREMGRGEQANELAAAYVAARQEDRRFFDLSAHHFTADDEADPALREAFAARRAEFIDNRNPGDVLVSMHERSGWNEEDVELLARLSVDEFEALFEATEGPHLVRAIKGARMVSGTPGEDGAKVRTAVTEALQRIAVKSPLRARQLRRFGIKPHQEKPADQEGPPGGDAARRSAKSRPAANC